MASAHGCTTSSGSGVPGSRRAGCPMPPGLPFHVWRSQPWLAALFSLSPVDDTSRLQTRREDRCAQHFVLLQSNKLKGASTLRHTHTRSTVSPPSWCNVSESRRSGEAGAEQRASGLVLGLGPKHCLIECRGGKDRTTRPLLQRLRLPSPLHINTVVYKHGNTLRLAT